MDIVKVGNSLPDVGRPLNILLSGVSSDSHTWNLVFLQLLIEYYGHQVVNLGACVPDDLIIDKCKQASVDMLVVSSVNGHGHLDGTRLMKKLRATSGLESLPCVIGGKLGTKGAENHQYVDTLHAAGFNAVYSDDGGALRLEDFMQFLTHAGTEKRVTHELQ